jgi:tetratricopeptide (TPR) repeat protein
MDYGLSDEPEVEAALRRTIGNTYLAIGLYDKAEEQLTSALDVRRKVLGKEHPLVAESLHDLAAFRLATGVDRDKLASADTLCREALAIRLRAFGENHPDVAASLQQLGKVHGPTELSAAESVYVRAIAIRERVMGEEDPEVAKGLLALAGVLRDLNRLAEAESCLHRSIEILRKRHP